MDQDIYPFTSPSRNSYDLTFPRERCHANQQTLNDSQTLSQILPLLTSKHRAT